MKTVFKLLFLFGGLIVIRFILCLYKYLQIKRYNRFYMEYILDKRKSISGHKPQILNLFIEANLKDNAVPWLEPKGYGQLLTTELSVFNNIQLKNEEVVQNVTILFREAIGYFKYQTLQSINPIFWLEFIVKLPEQILKIAGMTPGKALSTVLNLIYWICAIIVGLEELEIINIVRR